MLVRKFFQLLLLGKLEKHVNKGCLSDISAGCGSERNENMHKCIRKAVSKGHIRVLLALAICSSFLYKWNEKQKTRSKKTKDKVAIPISTRKAELSSGQRVQVV